MRCGEPHRRLILHLSSPASSSGIVAFCRMHREYLGSFEYGVFFHSLFSCRHLNPPWWKVVTVIYDMYRVKSGRDHTSVFLCCSFHDKPGGGVECGKWWEVWGFSWLTLPHLNNGKRNLSQPNSKNIYAQLCNSLWGGSLDLQRDSTRAFKLDVWLFFSTGSNSSTAIRLVYFSIIRPVTNLSASRSDWLPTLAPFLFLLMPDKVSPLILLPSVPQNHAVLKSTTVTTVVQEKFLWYSKEKIDAFQGVCYLGE